MSRETDRGLEDEESDEDLKQLIEQARRGRLEKQQAEKQSKPPQSTAAKAGSPDEDTRDKRTAPANGRPDYVVEILITSKIPGTKPVVINRKLSQRLKEVQEAYCNAMGFTPEMSRGMFLSWRNQKMWAYQTCEALGLELPSPSLDESEVPTIQISMELVTQEILEANRRAAERSLLEDPTGNDDAPQKSPAAEVLQADSTKVRVILRSKDYGELRIAVKPVRDHELFSDGHFADSSRIRRSAQWHTHIGKVAVSTPTKSFASCLMAMNWLGINQSRMQTLVTWISSKSISSRRYDPFIRGPGIER